MSENDMQVPNKPRVLVVVSGGVAYCLADGGVDVALIDYDNEPDAAIEPRFADLLSASEAG
ncbi:hypothetical protein [Salinisphaera shabanensis]|uniref:hypothetical protein n=1 Tax=Salinisphaera shabanensis TaxID=180542 RepID=UPI00333F1BB2